ncbi:MAG: tRNA uridine-5-carboxymethylaminomethyl(34) synthesis GTPase MnmE [Clostridia bacterium]|nr:tRNA uridine-5-carboxymethylaminomethyl(34) synthesis GTPase MnmE [Clostridia bacterium]
MSMLTDTIAAVSTPRGKGGVALIRISGPSAAEIGRRVFRPAGAKYPDELPRRAVFGSVFFPESGENAGEFIDSCLCTFFPGPHSFSGEDTAEICCHGGVLVTRTVLEAVLAAGARQAEAGEFTRRAFAHGRISLPEAEALGLLLEAGTDRQLKLSHSGLNGRLTGECSALREEIVSLLTDLYARIDFPEEDLGSIPLDEVISRTDSLICRTQKLSASYRTGKAVAEGIRTVICGRTNVGKSTLYNRLTGTDDAIVTDIAGTTRDTLSSVVSFGGVTLKLADTAGIRSDAADKVESIGIDRARKHLNEAELVFFLIDGTREPDVNDISIANELKEDCDRTVIALLTKADVGTVNGAAAGLWSDFTHRLKISAADGSGIDELAGKVSELFTDGSIDLANDPVVSSARQFDALSRAADALNEASSALRGGFSADIASVCLEDAAEALAALDGRGFGAVSADVIDGIFSKFCVGK